MAERACDTASMIECQGNPVYNKLPEFNLWSLHLYYFYSFSGQSTSQHPNLTIFRAFVTPNAGSSDLIFWGKKKFFFFLEYLGDSDLVKWVSFLLVRVD